MAKDFDLNAYLRLQSDIELWDKIHIAAKTDPVIRDALDGVVMLYLLKKDSNGSKTS